MRRWGVVLALTIAAAIATEAASRFIGSQFPDRPVAPDLLYEVLPHVPAASYLTLGALIASIALFAVYAVRNEPERIPEFLAVVAVMYLLRATMVALTPLAIARDEPVMAFPLFANALFPSGHTAVVLLLMMFTDRTRAPVPRTVQAILLLVVMVTMLYSRGHYSIDIVGGLLLAYFIEREWTRGRLFDPTRRLVAPAGA